MSKIDKTELEKKILALDGLDNESKSQLLELLHGQKRYGLVWEDKPEDVEERLRKELPVLKEVKERAIISEDSSAPNHILIEGDNLEALTALSYTHEGKIDVIYIDPPYNTGNKDFVYNDSFVDAEDDYRHSKWLSFMAKRLKIAKRLLSDSGIILISIDDNEYANLKLLCDELFNSNNYVASFIWRGGIRALAKYISTSHEYILMYAKNLNYCSSTNVEWREQKKGLREIYSTANRLVCENKGNYEEASKALKLWFKSLPEDNPSKDHQHYCWIDDNGVYFASDISKGGGGGPKWSITNPYTGEICKTPLRGWAYKTIEDLQKDIANGLIHFTGNGVPCKKRYLKDNETQILETVFYKDRRGAMKRLREIMGNEVFTFPKDEIVIKEKIKSFSNPQSIVLDFFAGSGTTLHSTMLLNKEDGGHRQCILVTNNENNICEEVTYERNKRVIQGYTNSKGEQVAGLTGNNLRYYKTDFVARESSQTAKRELMYTATDMLCIKNDLYSEQETFGGRKFRKDVLRYFAEGDKRMLVIYQPDAIETVVGMIQQMQLSEPIIVYVFSLNDYAMDEDFEDVADKVSLCALPDAILRAYWRVLPKKRMED